MVIKCLLHTSGTKDKELVNNMRLAWLTKIPTIGVPVRGEGASTLLADVFPKTEAPVTPTPPVMRPPQPPENAGVAKMWDAFLNQIKQLLKGLAPSNVNVKQPFLLHEQKQKELIDAYAESPFERHLFSLSRKPQGFVISKAWASGIKSPDPLVRDAALSLLRSWLSYTGLDTNHQLSAHTEMKLLMFSPHLGEGPLGKAVLYEALLSLPVTQFMEFSPALRKDFVTLPPAAQVLILKQLMNRWKKQEKMLSEDDAAGVRKLIKALVIQFYGNRQESLSQTLNQQEKIRMGFLKFQPVEEAYRKQLEEIERRYRLKLRQLKKRRSQKVAEAEEEKLRRIELIYDSVEGNLISGLGELELELEQVLAG